MNTRVETRGACPVCKRLVGLIYERGQTTGKLVIGPHGKPITMQIAQSLDRSNCMGYLEAPQKETARE